LRTSTQQLAGQVEIVLKSCCSEPDKACQPYAYGRKGRRPVSRAPLLLALPAPPEMLN